MDHISYQKGMNEEVVQAWRKLLLFYIVWRYVNWLHPYITELLLTSVLLWSMVA